MTRSAQAGRSSAQGASSVPDTAGEPPGPRLFIADGRHTRTLVWTTCAGIAIALAVGQVLGWSEPATGAAVLLGLAAPLLTVIDLREHRLPDLITLPLAAACLLALAVGSLVTGEWSVLLRGGIGAFGLALVFFVLFIFANGAFGFGDVKLGVSMGACLGVHGVFPVVLAVLLGLGLALVVALVLMGLKRARWRTHIALGPYLLIGTLLTLVMWG
ncbi:leader peptidase (prepilin peptidase) / N-methyltransferase [Brevibacterium pityocampae]